MVAMFVYTIVSFAKCLNGSYCLNGYMRASMVLSAYALWPIFMTSTRLVQVLLRLRYSRDIHYGLVKQDLLQAVCHSLFPITVTKTVKAKQIKLRIMLHRLCVDKVKL